MRSGGSDEDARALEGEVVAHGNCVGARQKAERRKGEI